MSCPLPVPQVHPSQPQTGFQAGASSLLHRVACYWQCCPQLSASELAQGSRTSTQEGQTPCLALPDAAPRNGHYSQHYLRLSEEGGAVRCFVSPKLCLMRVMAFLRCFCHEMGRGFLTSKFCWRLDDSQERASPLHGHFIALGRGGWGIEMSQC